MRIGSSKAGIGGLLAVMAIALLVASPVSGASVKGIELTKVSPDGRNITFKDGGKTVKSKVSGSRTKVTIGGKESDRENLKAGMKCDIDYKADGKKNEPSMVAC